MERFTPYGYNVKSQSMKNRIVRFRGFSNSSILPLFNEKIKNNQAENDLKSYLHFIVNTGIKFEAVEQLKNEIAYEGLYNLIISNVAYFERSDKVIELYLLLIDRLALAACIELESINTDNVEVFEIIKNALWGKDHIVPKPFNTFQQCLFLKLCSIIISNSTPVSIKMDIFGKLCEDESRRIGNSIYDDLGFYMPGSDFHGMWVKKNDKEYRHLQISTPPPFSDAIQNPSNIKLIATDTKLMQPLGSGGSTKASTEPLQTITEKLKAALGEYGFYKLELIKELKEDNLNLLILEISKNQLPYKIAMLDFLGFIEHLRKEHFTIKAEVHKKLANLLDSSSREIKGNINVLNPVSNEDRKRYTADQYSERVKRDYNKLK